MEDLPLDRTFAKTRVSSSRLGEIPGYLVVEHERMEFGEERDLSRIITPYSPSSKAAVFFR